MSYKGADQHDADTTHAGFAVTAKHMSITNKGSKVKASKKEIEWQIGLCAKDAHLTLLDSIMSGRKQIFINGDKVHDVKIPKSQTTWAHVIVYGKFRLEVRINGDGDNGVGPKQARYDLRINGVPYRQLRRGSVFQKGSQPPPPPPPGPGEGSDSEEEYSGEEHSVEETVSKKSKKKKEIQEKEIQEIEIQDFIKCVGYF